MKQFNDCKSAIEECLNSKRFTISHQYSESSTMEMHIHNCYEIYYSISGGKQFLIDNKYYEINPGDVFFINQFESHYISKIDESIHERIVISIHPSLLQNISTKQTDLSFCFTNRNIHFSHRLHLKKDAQQRFLFLVHKMITTKGYGQDVIENSLLSELLIMLTAIMIDDSKEEESLQTRSHNQLALDILNFINKHLSDDLSIKQIAEEFFISESYVCRIFKAETGTTINKYITARRISVAKSLLADGYNVSEACEKCGFKDYTNFVKCFTKIVGISPKRYGKYSGQ